jgi:hypothetical protein
VRKELGAAHRCAQRTAAAQRTAVANSINSIMTLSPSLPSHSVRLSATPQDRPRAPVDYTYVEKKRRHGEATASNRELVVVRQPI